MEDERDDATRMMGEFLTSFFSLLALEPHSYHGHAAPCDDANVNHPPKKEGGPNAIVLIGVLLLVFGVVTGVVMVIRGRRWNEAARKSGEDPDDDENIAAGETRGEII